MTRVLVIDDEPLVRSLMVEILDREGYDVLEAESATHALGLLDDPSVSLVVSDVMMPGLSGFQLLEELRLRRPSLPVLLVTGAGTEGNLAEALVHGAAGLLMKPFSASELQTQVWRVLQRARGGEQELRERIVAPVLTHVLAQAVTARDITTGGHSERLVSLAVSLGEALDLRSSDLDALRLGASLHDIGKIGIPDRILLKPGPLDADECALMQTHTLIGDRLLEQVPELAAARPVVRSHHERWDGRGYPDRLAGEKIPLVARVVAVADAIEAMSGARPYRDTFDWEQVVRELRAGSGTQWDPTIVDVAVDLIEHGEVGNELVPQPSSRR